MALKSPFAFASVSFHSFAGDDRGWHLLALLERLTRIAGRELHRVGLSATIGNPNGLLHWLSGYCEGSGVVIEPGHSRPGESDVQVDFVGNIENAALVISRLHRGEKRLVFTDSRAQAEQVAARLRRLGVQTFVSHSSLSAEERRQAEGASALARSDPPLLSKNDPSGRYSLLGSAISRAKDPSEEARGEKGGVVFSCC